MVITRSDIAKNKLTDSKAIGLKPAKRKIKPLSCIVAKYKVGFNFIWDDANKERS